MAKEIVRFSDFEQEVQRRRPRTALVLGSGLGDLANRLADVVRIPFLQIPGLPATSVQGHRGELLLGVWADAPVLVFSGRVHYYEGHAWRTVVRPVHVAAELGCKFLLATNAAGGIRDDLEPGSLMPIRDHFDCTTADWWRRFALGATGPASPYSARLLEILISCGQSLGWSMVPGVYAQLTGPTYETPAEIRAFRTMGVDAVGMSTGREVRAGREKGMECAGLSCITNKAAGLSTAPIHHGEVMDVASKVRERMTNLIEAFVASLDNVGC